MEEWECGLRYREEVALVLGEGGGGGEKEEWEEEGNGGDEGGVHLLLRGVGRGEMVLGRCGFCFLCVGDR